MSARLRPVADPLDAAIATALEHYPRRDGYLLQLFRVFANSLRFVRKGTVNLLDRDSPLPMRQREIVILRICANNHCEYEWGVHVTAFADHVKLTAEQVRATRLLGADAPCWSSDERLLLAAVDELCGVGRIRPDTYAMISERWNEAQQLEILALAGNYHTVSFVANTADLPLEGFAARFPAP